MNILDKLKMSLEKGLDAIAYVLLDEIISSGLTEWTKSDNIHHNEDLRYHFMSYALKDTSVNNGHLTYLALFHQYANELDYNIADILAKYPLPKEDKAIVLKALGGLMDYDARGNATILILRYKIKRAIEEREWYYD